MGTNAEVPDAWDEDWQPQADVSLQRTYRKSLWLCIAELCVIAAIKRAHR